MNQIDILKTHSVLGKKTTYPHSPQADILFPIPRALKREELGIENKLPFQSGYDLWNHYEVSYLNPQGKPCVALAEIYIDCLSPCIVESKSMKLYFNALNDAVFTSDEELAKHIEKDLREKTQSQSVFVFIRPLSTYQNENIVASFEGICIDGLDVDCDTYTIEPGFLTTQAIEVEEILCSDLLKSNCLVTNQPDWCSLQIHYRGPKIDPLGLLRYIVSFRHCNEFTEQCIEKIFVHIMEKCQPKSLTIRGHSTRRGGLDICPIRSTEKITQRFKHIRLARQ